MKTLDDSAIAYGFMMIGVFIIFAGFTLAIFSPVINHLIAAENGFVAEGGVSVATNNSVAWCVGGCILMVVATLGGALYWVVVRSNEQRQFGSS